MPALVWRGQQYIDIVTSLPVDLPVTSLADWSDTNLPWAYTDTAQFREKWPDGVRVVPIQTGSTDFHTNLTNTINAAGGRVVVELGQGVYSFDRFRPIGASGDPTYSFGFWHPNLRGLVGQGADRTYVQMNANSMSQAQLDRLATMTSAAFAPTQMGLMRIDGSATSPALIAGLTFRAADQQMLTAKASDIPAIIPQPAPHNGLQIYGNSHALISYVRFQAAGRGSTSAPPFECANAQSGASVITWDHCEFDGRRSPDLDPARPRRCGPVMVNGETLSVFEDCWFHHSNISRYAANDQSRNHQGEYQLTRCRLNNITDTRNTDPALNGGQTLGGFTNATPLGWESTNGTISVTDCRIEQDNPHATGQVPCHFQLTHVGSRNPQGGRMYVSGTVCETGGFPTVGAFITFRISASTFWWTDGPATTLHVHHPETGARLNHHLYTGAWPPNAATLATAGITPATHYLIRHA